MSGVDAVDGTRPEGGYYLTKLLQQRTASLTQSVQEGGNGPQVLLHPDDAVHRQLAVLDGWAKGNDHDLSIVRVIRHGIGESLIEPSATASANRSSEAPATA